MCIPTIEPVLIHERTVLTFQSVPGYRKNENKAQELRHFGSHGLSGAMSGEVYFAIATGHLRDREGQSFASRNTDINREDKGTRDTSAAVKAKVSRAATLIYIEKKNVLRLENEM